MKTEADFKTAFSKSVKRHKGVCIKLAAPLLVGIPDLYVIIPGYMPVLLEAKWLGQIRINRFSRKMNYTETQIRWIRECCEVQEFAALGLAGYQQENNITAVMLKYGTPEFYQVSNGSIYNCGLSTIYKHSQIFDVPYMFEKAGIPKLKVNKGTELLHYGAERSQLPKLITSVNMVPVK
jgi:hypothetical protein